MKTASVLLRVGAIINALFVLFHVWLGWRIHQLKMDPGLRPLLEMLNGGGTVFILFIAITSWLGAKEAARDERLSAVTRAMIFAPIALYALRAVAEVLIAPRMSPLILAVCTATALLYAAILITARQSWRPGTRD